MLDKVWYRRTPSLLSLFLIPISFIFSKIANSRKLRQQLEQYKSYIPVVIVGNISVGGTGKTPVVRKLAWQYLQQSKRVAIISRGYGAKADSYPFEVARETLASQCGDEPAMLYDALDAKVPIVISPQRVDSVRYVEQNYPDTDVIISDDGLQHYKLGRDKEIVVVDANRMFGNRLCLPAGPLREPVKRLQDVDEVIVIGDCSDEDRQMLKNYNKNIEFSKIIATKFVNVKTKEVFSIDKFYGTSVTAIAGIGNPDKFFSSLSSLDINICQTRIFKDHHKFIPKDFDDINSSQNVLMTYKDAIKCKDFAKENWWYLDIDLDNPGQLH